MRLLYTFNTEAHRWFWWNLWCWIQYLLQLLWLWIIRGSNWSVVIQTEWCPLFRTSCSIPVKENLCCIVRPTAQCMHNGVLFHHNNNYSLELWIHLDSQYNHSIAQQKHTDHASVVINKVATGQEMVREKNLLHGQGTVVEYWLCTWCISVAPKSNTVNVIRKLVISKPWWKRQENDTKQKV